VLWLTIDVDVDVLMYDLFAFEFYELNIRQTNSAATETPTVLEYDHILVINLIK